MTTIPGSPHRLDTVSLALNPLHFATQHAARHGHIFRSTFFGTPTIILLGADAQRFVLSAPQQSLFSSFEGNKIGYDLFGDGLFWLDGERHDRDRRLLLPAFHHTLYPAYFQTVLAIIDRHLTPYSGQRGTLDWGDWCRRLTFEIAATLILSERTDLALLERDWSRFAAGALALFHTTVPWSRYGIAKRAQARILSRSRQILQARRAHPTTDMLSMLVIGQRADGSTLTDDEILGHLPFLMYAGYDTTASTLTWLLLELMSAPELWTRLITLAHQTTTLTLTDLAEPWLDALIDETLRLHPQLNLIIRGVTERFAYSGYVIPAGVHVMLLPAYTHRMDAYFPEPDAFQPDRFLPPRDEHKQTPFAYIGFGGGPRTCLGEGIARMVIKCVLLRVFQTLRLHPPRHLDSTPSYVPLSRPRSRLRVAYS